MRGEQKLLHHPYENLIKNEAISEGLAKMNIDIKISSPNNLNEEIKENAAQKISILKVDIKKIKNKLKGSSQSKILLSKQNFR